MRFSIRDLDAEFTKTEDDIKALQSVGQIIGEVLKKLDDERCKSTVSLLLSSSSRWVMSPSSRAHTP